MSNRLFKLFYLVVSFLFLILSMFSCAYAVSDAVFLFLDYSVSFSAWLYLFLFWNLPVFLLISYFSIRVNLDFVIRSQMFFSEEEVGFSPIFREPYVVNPVFVLFFFLILSFVFFLFCFLLFLIIMIFSIRDFHLFTLLCMGLVMMNLK